MVFMGIWRIALPFLALTALSGCASTTGEQAKGAQKLDVAAAFYPLQFVTERVGGARVAVRSLTKPGTEPHDVELTPKDVAAVQDADLLVYLSKFQAQVDDAAAKATSDRRLDVASATYVDMLVGAAGDDNAPRDPHFWLDPLSLGKVAVAVAERLSAIDPGGKAAYATAAATLTTELDQLDADFTVGLQNCAGRNLVTAHSAFGYLARRYSLTQVGIAGLNAEAEPTAADQARAVAFARTHNVKTIFTEPLVSDAIAESVANEIGGRTAVLDPVEGITAKSRGSDYLQVMRSNLAALRAGLVCP